MSQVLLSLSETSLVRLDIRTEDSEWQGLYDRIEVLRAVLGESGPYVALTGEFWMQATLPEDFAPPSGGSGPQANIVGKDLILLVNEKYEVNTVFTGTDPLTFLQAAGQITTAANGQLTAYVDTNGKLVLRSIVVGGMSSIRVVGGEAAPLLGLTVGDIALGTDPRIPLVAGKTNYAFTDFFGNKKYFYKTRFMNSTTSAKSTLTVPFSARAAVGIDPKNIVRGYVRLLRRDGQPDAKKEVTIYAPTLGFQVDGATVTGGQELFLTDEQGYIEVRLIRGMDIDVGIGGTSLIRRVKVPTDSAIEKFDLLSPEYGQDDAFAVKRVETPYAERRNF